MDVDALLEAIYRQLCARQRAEGAGAEMSLADLRVAERDRVRQSDPEA
jgi:hypothetical protein